MKWSGLAACLAKSYSLPEFCSWIELISSNHVLDCINTFFILEFWLSAWEHFFNGQDSIFVSIFQIPHFVDGYKIIPKKDHIEENDFENL